MGLDSAIPSDLRRAGGPAILDKTKKLPRAYVTTAAITGCDTFLLSFETGYIGTFKWYPGFACTVNKLCAVVAKAIEATADATITCGNSVGASANGVLTVTKADAIGTVETAVSPTTNNTVAADSYYYMTTAKANVGGSVWFTIQYTRADYAITA